jgi:hypothetical protein
MPRKPTKPKKKVFEKDTNIETGFSTLQETDHRIPIRGRSGAPPDLWENQIEGLAGKAKSDLPFERPTDDLHPDANRVRGTSPPYAPDKQTVEAAKRELKRTEPKKTNKKKAA